MRTANVVRAANSEINTITYSTIACPLRRDRINLYIHARIISNNGSTMESL
jgi:hypothetical protein